MIRVRDLTKIYRVHKRPPGFGAAVKSIFVRKFEEVRAVDKISFAIGDGERVGFLGPNGAGKTTTLKMLAGLLHPNAGELDVDGFVPGKRDAAFLRRVTLVMGQKQQLLWDLPPAETFEMNRAIYGIPRADFTTTVKELSELLELGNLVNKPSRNLSLGERMKCELAAALLHKPELLFLDEPTIGLDVSMQATIRDFIRRYNERYGATIMLTSHYMEDVEALCPRVIVIHQGHLIHDGKLADLVHSIHPEKRLKLNLSRAVDAADLEKVGRVVENGGLSVTLTIDRSRLSEAMQRAAALPVIDLSVEDAPLEDVMRDLFASVRAPRDGGDVIDERAERGDAGRPNGRPKAIARTEPALVRAARAFPWMLRVSFAEAVAYRAEFLVWMLSTTMPFIQMALMRAIAFEAPVHGADRTYGPADFTGYYLAALLVRMLTGAWVVWEMSQEVRTGSFSIRLLRPIHPFLSYASDNLAAIPMRGVLGIPIVIGMMIAAPNALTHDWRLLLLGAVTIAFAWLINFLVNCATGSLAFVVENVTSVIEVWLAVWMIFSGYLFPLDLFPQWVRAILEWLPFHLMMDLPVRCLTGTITVDAALIGLGEQVLWIGGLFLLATATWRWGMKKFSAVGG